VRPFTASAKVPVGASVTGPSTVNDTVAVPEVPLGTLASAVSDVLKLRFAEVGNGPVANTDELEQL